MKNLFLIATTLVFSQQPLNGQNKPIYKDTNAPVEQRVEDLISRMTIDEKVDQLSMMALELELDENGKVVESSTENLFQGKSIGVISSPFIEHSKIAQFSEAADHYLRTKTRLGIPAIQIAECLHGHMALGTTIFPQAIAMGSSWNPELIKQVAAATAKEASLSGVDQALSPVFDLARDARFGRFEECYGEDPFHVKTMGVAFVTGMQGEPEQTKIGIEKGKIGCTAKHFVGNAIPEAGINIAPALIGERELREFHFIPFEGAVKEANIYSVMPGYHEIDGVPAHGNYWLLNKVLREEWNFDGYVFSDYGAVYMLNYLHYVAEDGREAARRALESGVDLEAPDKATYAGYIKSLVESGDVDISIVDRAVKNVLRIKFKLGLFDRPFKVESKEIKKVVHSEEHIALSQKVAEESIVLLKNRNNILPLHKESLSSIAVIGANADKVQFGDYSITKNNDYGTTPLEGIRAIAGDNLEVNYALGCGITSLSKEGFSEAIESAKKSEVIIYVAGGTSIIYSGIGWGDQNSQEINTCGEGFDRNELGLPGVQGELLSELQKLGKPIIMVLVNGRPYTLEKEFQQLDGVIEAWYSGEKGGDAIARIIFGEVNPSGRLSVTFPPTVGHIGMYANYKPSAKGFYRQRGSEENPGRDYVFSSPDPLFCLGYGLSYTTFEYSDIAIDYSNIYKEKGELTVSFTLKNSGEMDGAEVAQLYIRDLFSSVTTPVRALKGFKKVFLKRGESTRVEINVDKSQLALWNVNMEQVVEPGTFEVHVGSSVEDIKLSSKFDISKQ
ncbi:MAG: glycoside hydrolase family 3 N-terminal domain-containing protein [Rikenellaceae bacterium]